MSKVEVVEWDDVRRIVNSKPGLIRGMSDEAVKFALSNSARFSVSEIFTRMANLYMKNGLLLEISFGNKMGQDIDWPLIIVKVKK